MSKQTFKYLRYTAKCVGLAFIVPSVSFLVAQLLLAPQPKYTRRFEFVAAVIIGGLFWALDRLWSTLKDLKEIQQEIDENNRSKKQ